jgi:hypothetical protein
MPIIPMIGTPVMIGVTMIMSIMVDDHDRHDQVTDYY